MDSVCADTSLTPQQQPAVDMVEAVPEQVVDTPAPEVVNADPPANDSSTNSNADAAPTTAAEQPAPVQPKEPATYDDLFPSLPTAAPGQSGNGSSAGNAWSKKPSMIMSS